MKNILVEHMHGKSIGNGILQISQAATKAKQSNPAAINATIGTLSDDQAILYKFDAIDKIIKEASYADLFSYAHSTGGDGFKEAVEKLLFEDEINFEKLGLFSETIATPGATGALSLAIKNYAPNKSKVIFSDLSWDAYKIICLDKDIKHETFPMFDQEKFNLNGLQAAIDNVKNEQENIVIVINDPCHNPTGYSMTIEEWQGVFNIINNVTKYNHVTLIYDLAYLEFGNKKLFFDNIKNIKNLNDNFTAILTFSGSKSLALYGTRIGAAMCISKNKTITKQFIDAMEYSTRASWSNCSRLGITVITRLSSNQTKLDSYKQELISAQKMLSERVELFVKLSKLHNLKHLPIENSFFAFIQHENPHGVYDELVKNNVHIVPMNNGIRIALCSINSEEIEKLVPIIARIINEEK